MSRAHPWSWAATASLVAARWLTIPLLRRDRRRIAAGACRACHALGSTYLKFGQLVASSPGLVGDDVAAAFRSCLDTGPPISARALAQAVERAAARPLAAAYRHLERAPLGKASVAVVHRGVTADGQEVAIKVRRPGIAARVTGDIRVLRGLTRLAQRLGRADNAEQLLDLIDDLSQNIAAGLDFTGERAAMVRIGARLAAHGLTQIRVPRTFPRCPTTACW